MKIRLRLRFIIVLLSLLLSIAVSAVRAQPAQSGINTNKSRFPCLQTTISSDDVVTFRRKGTSKNLTVKGKLIELKARCRKGKLVDGRRREIRFFKAACWGNPPADYIDILRKQHEEVVELKKKYTVIEMACNPSVM